MRTLQTHDLFTAMKIINAAGIRDEIKRTALLAQNKQIKVEEIGIDFILGILGACADKKAEDAIYEFLGGLMEIEPKEIKVMNPLDLIEEIKKLSAVIDVEAWRNFFQLLLVSIQKQK